MEKNGQILSPPDLRNYEQGRRQFPLEELAKYAGQYVAFSPDGTRILASGETEAIMDQRLQEIGIHPSQVVGSYIDPD